MRTAGMPELKALMVARNELERASAQAQVAADTANATIDRLVAKGRNVEAAEMSAAAAARWQMAVVAIGARYEPAAVALLGEKLRADETTSDYVARTWEVAQDFQRMRAMQETNGVIWQ